MVRVRLPMALRRYGPAEAEVSGATVGAALEALCARFPELRPRLLDARGGLPPHLRVFVEGRAAGLEAPLEPGAVVEIVAAVAGG